MISKLVQNIKTLFQKNRLSTITIIGIVLALIIAQISLSPWCENCHKADEKAVIESDVVHYYSFLPALFIENDLSYSFKEKITYSESNNRPIYYTYKNDRGQYVEKVTIGMSIMYLPFFILGHLSALTLGFETHGFSTPYEISLALSSIFYCLIGLLAIRKILLIHFNEIATSITLIALVFGTNLFHYITYEPAMTHAYSFALIALFCYCSIRYIENQKRLYIIALSICLGLIFLIRPVNILIVLFPILYNVNSIESLKSRINLFLGNYQQILLAILVGFLVCIPQFLYWKYATGQWIYYSFGDERFFFNDSKIIDGLFSFRKGWLIYTPIMSISLVGIAMSIKKRENSVFFFLLLLPILWFVTFAWWTWWYGGGFGCRPMIDFYGILAIPFCYVISQFTTLKINFANLGMGLILIGLIGLNQFQSLQYKRGAIHSDAMTFEAYCINFLSLKQKAGFQEALDFPDYKKAIKGIGR